MSPAARPTSPSAGPDASTPVGSPVAPCPDGCPRCHAEITSAQLKTIFPGATDAKRDAVMAAFNDAFEKFAINTCHRKAHFFAQIREEVGGAITTLAENMNYAAAALKGLFGYFKKHPADALLYGRTPKHRADQEAIGNRAYANRLGNGDIASGDGWRYRGKGYIQLTGKSNYQSVQTEIDAKYPGSGIDIIKNGDDILTVKGGMISAMAFWSMNGLNAKADKGATDAHVNAVTATVNFHTKSYAERRTHFGVTKVVFKVAECTNK